MIRSDTIPETPIFSGIRREELGSLLACLSARTKKFDKNQTIYFAGSEATEVGLVLSGSVLVIKEDFWGNRTILSEVRAGGLFVESFCYSKTRTLPVSVIAYSDCEILFIDYLKILRTCSSSCAFHARLIENMMMILADKNVLLNEKIQVMGKRSIREKLLAYLYGESQKAGSPMFMIPYNRQELADFLSVDRSAMSTELGKLRDEGVLSFHRSSFKLNRTPHI